MSDERIVDLGPGMFGVISVPPGNARASAVVLFNAGIMHRTGPFRVSVRLARALAARGYTTLRFDLPGVGDSLKHADRPLLQITREVLDRLQVRTGCTRFIVGGICSGADIGWRLAVDDSRVAGIIMLDGLARRRWWFRIGRLKRMLARPPSAWLATLRRRLAPGRPAAGPAADLRDWPAPGQERSQLRQLITRGVRLFMAYTGGASYFIDPRQFRETYGPLANASAVDFNYWPDSDHMFYAESDRALLITKVGEWMANNFE